MVYSSWYIHYRTNGEEGTIIYRHNKKGKLTRNDITCHLPLDLKRILNLEKTPIIVSFKKL